MSYRMTTKQKIAAHAILKDVLQKVPNTDYWEYIDNNSDESVAKAISHVLNRNHILTLRRELFGKLRPAPTAAHVNLEERLDSLKDRLDSLTYAFQDLLDRFNTHVRRGHHNSQD